ncbi:DUF4159 domain-containing protein [Paracrocinitomix mangrovi]|uniref:DUF4159 domain-containing protein n=1 Tax=Paracrocinitomix mangrovi TaxID=2862509 RepID=UPI001C8EDF43|nr:DUF4159 domain-containing protein [Paracrocinitomix mangrovi]UKN02818.1 DUF4159 domain-containing protein [Paracrocinitomix mangrovi]
MSYRLFIVIALIINLSVFGQSSYQVAVLKYSGGGDWYANPTSLPNLVKFCNKNLGTNISEKVETVGAGDPNIFNYPFVHMTGHGNVVFSSEDAENLRNYLLGGGFLHIDDNYGMDKFIRTEIQKVFPNNEFVELPFTHPIFHQKYEFKKGLPKIHEHEDKRPQAFGIMHEGRLICLYTYECDLGDGWEDEEVHGDSESKRTEALKMGANIIQYAFTAAH